MDIIEFFEQSAGKWFSQRTSQNLSDRESAAASSDLWIESLDKDDKEAIALCQAHKVDSSEVLCAARIRWESKPLFNQTKQSGSTVLVALGQSDREKEGRLLQKTTSPSAASGVSRYVIGTDEAVTIIVESDAIYSEERIWFASENLRMRASITKSADSFSNTSFCTEIRMGGGAKK